MRLWVLGCLMGTVGCAARAGRACAEAEALDARCCMPIMSGSLRVYKWATISFFKRDAGFWASWILSEVPFFHCQLFSKG